MTLWLLLALVLTPAHAGKKKRKSDPEPAPEPVPTAPAVPPYEGLFSPLSLVQVGALPPGLANLSAQGCAACHPGTVHRWRQGPHGGPASSALQQAVVDQANPTCGVCHWPLEQQQPLGFTPSIGSVPSTTAKGGFDLTLRGEGVTCVACHVREGAVIASTPGPHRAPHPVRYGPELADGSVCGACHQLEVDGVALYDTVGEWERSPYAANDIGCLDCHGRRGPDGRSMADHGMVPDGAVALSVLVTADRTTLVRGGDPLEVTITVQNTGAGHHWPSGGPWSGARLEAALVGHDDDGNEVRAATFAYDLARRFDEGWNVLEDTRLPAASSHELSWSPALPQDAPAGPWHVEVTVQPTARGAAHGPPRHRTTLRLDSD